jgi:hypothetical protein
MRVTKLSTSREDRLLRPPFVATRSLEILSTPQTLLSPRLIDPHPKVIPHTPVTSSPRPDSCLETRKSKRQTHPLFTLGILIHSSHMLIPIGVHRIGLVEPVSLFFCQFLGL